jgi:hypothetical protein
MKLGCHDNICMDAATLLHYAAHFGVGGWFADNVFRTDWLLFGMQMNRLNCSCQRHDSCLVLRTMGWDKIATLSFQPRSVNDITRQTVPLLRNVLFELTVAKYGMNAASGILETRYGTLFVCKETSLWLLVRKRTVTTDRPQLVGEVSANFCG